MSIFNIGKNKGNQQDEIQLDSNPDQEAKTGATAG